MTEHPRNMVATSDMPAIDGTPENQVQPEAAPVEYLASIPDGMSRKSLRAGMP